MQAAAQSVMQAAAEFSLEVLNLAEDSKLPIETTMTGLSVLVYGLATQFLLDKGLPVTQEAVGNFIVQHARYTIDLSATLMAADQSTKPQGEQLS